MAEARIGLSGGFTTLPATAPPADALQDASGAFAIVFTAALVVAYRRIRREGTAP